MALDESMTDPLWKIRFSILGEPRRSAVPSARAFDRATFAKVFRRNVGPATYGHRKTSNGRSRLMKGGYEEQDRMKGEEVKGSPDVDETICISNYSLSAAACCARICNETEHFVNEMIA
eukprot:Selendium_serpulae@DN5205_c0_g1_i1.p1